VLSRSRNQDTVNPLWITYAWDDEEEGDFSYLVQELAGIGIALIGLIIVWAVAYFFLFKWTSDDVAKSLDTVIRHEKLSSTVGSDYE